MLELGTGVVRFSDIVVALFILLKMVMPEWPLSHLTEDDRRRELSACTLVQG